MRIKILVVFSTIKTCNIKSTARGETFYINNLNFSHFLYSIFQMDEQERHGGIKIQSSWSQGVHAEFLVASKWPRAVPINQLDNWAKRFMLIFFRCLFPLFHSSFFVHFGKFNPSDNQVNYWIWMFLQRLRWSAQHKTRKLNVFLIDGDSINFFYFMLQFEIINLEK